MRKLLFINLVVALGIANANILVFQAVLTEKEFNQQDSSPCVIGDSSCKIGLLPGKTELPNGNVGSYDALSPVYTVDQIRLAVGNDFFLGLDVNQTSVNQTLSLVEILINLGGGFTVRDSFSSNPAAIVPPTVGGGNGTGYADYTLTNVTTLAGLAGNTTVQFHLVMPLVNDGQEQLFLIPNGGGGGGAVVPEPASMMLFGGGLIGLAVAFRKKLVKR